MQKGRVFRTAASAPKRNATFITFALSANGALCPAVKSFLMRGHGVGLVTEFPHVCVATRTLPLALPRCPSP